MGTGFSKKKKQARMMQEQLTKMQSQMQHAEVTGVSGNGLITIVLSGEGDMKQIKIKSECVDPEDVDGLQDLIKAAHADAQKQLKAQQMEGMPPMPNLGAFGM